YRAKHDRISARHREPGPRRAAAGAEYPGAVRLLRAGNAQLAVLATGSTPGLVATPTGPPRQLTPNVRSTRRWARQWLEGVDGCGVPRRGEAQQRRAGGC